MAVKTTYDQDRNLVVHLVQGEFRFEDFRAAYDEKLGHGSFRPGMNVIWDFRHAQADTIESDEIRKISDYVFERVEKRGRGYKVAIVVTGDLQYGLSRMYQSYSNSLEREIKLFRDSGSAFSWVNGNGSFSEL